jgi:hypothetical protein
MQDVHINWLVVAIHKVYLVGRCGDIKVPFATFFR